MKVTALNAKLEMSRLAWDLEVKNLFYKYVFNNIVW